MKIKQQKQIKAFLIEEFGESKANTLFHSQEKTLDTLIENTKNKSENQMKTLVQTVLPRIALYKTLSKDSLSKEDVYAYMRKYMLDKVAAKKHASTAKMELVPGFYSIYSHIFLKIMRTTDLQESVQSHTKDSYDVTITKCLWHTACQENGCEELCRLFCDADNIIGFTFTKKLSTGGDCCGFHFFKKQSTENR